MNQQAAAARDGEIAEVLTSIAVEAAMAIRNIDFRNVIRSEKDDRSPVTSADMAAQAAILRGLAGKLPGVPVVSEEAVGEWRDKRPPHAFLLVDPLDGTREFLAERDEYTVNIALVRDGVPVVGVVAAPALGLLWRGTAAGAERLEFSADGSVRAVAPIRTRQLPAGDRVAVMSRSHLDAASIAFLERFGPAKRFACGSALKFCRIAEGAADIYPRLGPTSEWDVAAGHALVVAAGGTMVAPDGKPLRYGTEGFRVPGFIAWGDRAVAAASIRPARP